MSDAAKRIKIPEFIGYERVEGDFVLINLKSGKYLGLDPIASLVWQVLTEGGGVDEAVRQIVSRYDAPESKVRQDVEDLLRNLEEKGVVEVGPAGDN